MAVNLLRSFAQYHEDIILLAALPDVDRGFYIDIGANDPNIDSVTRLFYLDGWSGINVDPLPEAHVALSAARPYDTNLNVAVGSHAGKVTFRSYPQCWGLSTLAPKEIHNGLVHDDYEVEVVTLASIFEQYVTRHVDFLKIDVEGAELQVLEGADWERDRPTVVCAEADDVSALAWEGYLEQRGYIKFYFDGLNRYYMAQESRDRLHNLGERLRVLTQRSVRVHGASEAISETSELIKLRSQIASRDSLIEELRSALRDAGEMIRELSGIEDPS